jgi:uncharacterized RDD family membrane protein YckC
MENVAIQTSQNVQLNYRMASVGERILAYLIDIFMLGVVYSAIAFFLIWAKVTSPFVYVGIALPFIAYHPIFEIIFEGQSLGKMIMKIKVIAIDGSSVSVGKYLIRWVMRLVDIVISGGLFALVAILASKQGQRIGDMAAGTSLVSTKLKPVFDESVFVDLPDDYQVVFPKAGDLEYGQIKTLLEVMKFYTEQPEKREAILMVYSARKNVETLFDVKSDLKPVEFIETVIRDFNALNRKNEG